MIRAYYFKENGELVTDLTPEGYPAALQDPQGLLWVDFGSEAPEACEPILRETFGFHPLAIADALHQSHVPKLDDWDSYLYIVLYGIVFHRQDEDIETVELDVFLGPNYIVTHHDIPIHPLNHVWETSLQRERFLKRGADHLLYRLADALVADYMQTVEEMDEDIAQIEDRVFTDPTTQTVQRIFTLRRSTLHFRRVISPLREVFNKLARDEFDVVDAKDQVYFRDLYDHLVRLHDITEGLRDLVGGTLETYLSVINNRMNEIMKTLTLITTLFMPITFIAGFFGMNYFAPAFPLDSWMQKPAFGAVMLLFIGTPFVMYLWMRRRGWMR